MGHTERHKIVRFADFVLDLRAGELRKAGSSRPISLSDQPLQVLRELQKQPGQMVSREELIQRLWPGGGFGDFDHGLNKAVNKLREALGDSAEKPKFIETVARRGYRFLAPVENEDAAGASTEASIAVLPFTNLSGDPGQDYFADGMTEALITELGKISALRVISRQSMMQYKGTKKSAQQIAQELNVEGIVEGSVLRVGDRVRTTAQLIAVRPERHLWANSYDRELRDVLELENEMARAVAKEIKVTLTPEDEARLRGTRTVNPPAHEAYLQGRYFLDRRTKAGVDKALGYFQRAIELDPTYASAYASLAEMFLVQGLYDPTHQMELLAKSKAASLKALELDDRLSTAHYTLAAQRLRVWNWSGSEVEYRRAIELNPSDATAHAWYANLLITMGRMTEAEVEMQRAQDLDPLSLEVYGAATAFLWYARRYDELISRCREWVERDANLEWYYHHTLGAAYVQMGRHQEAITELRIALKSSTLHDHTATELANALAVTGKREEALKMLDQVENTPWRTFGAALVHTGLGESDEAFRSLQGAIELRAPWPFVSLLKQDPRFDSLRQDPRFQDLLSRMSFPQ
jgi:TolB-like protein/Tfp pilus assembly protein PilF